MDISTIIVAVLALAGSLVGTYFSNNKTTGLILYRLEQLEKKVEKHNSVVERTYKVEKDIEKMQVVVEDLQHDLEKTEIKIT